MDVTNMAVTISPLSFMWDEEIPRTLNEVGGQYTLSGLPSTESTTPRALCHELCVLRANSSDLPARGNAFLDGGG